MFRVQLCVIWNMFFVAPFFYVLKWIYNGAKQTLTKENFILLGFMILGAIAVSLAVTIPYIPEGIGMGFMLYQYYYKKDIQKNGILAVGLIFINYCVFETILLYVMPNFNDADIISKLTAINAMAALLSLTVSVVMTGLLSIRKELIKSFKEKYGEFYTKCEQKYKK